MAAGTASTAGTTSSAPNPSISRTRSVRSGAPGTPVSARAAARRPADASGDDDAKAELQAQLADLQQRLVESESALSSSQKQGEVLRIKLDEALKEQGILEDNMHESSERLEELENEKRELLRGKRELEAIFESERVASMKEREDATVREEEMQRNLVRMKDALSQQKLGVSGEEEPVAENRRGSRPLSISRTSSFRSGTASPGHPEGGRQFAPSSSASLQRSDSRSSSRVILEKDRMIESLRLDLAEAQIKLVELDNKGGSNLQQLEKQMYDVKIQNARLMEENESFQLLLRDKTLSGDLMLRAPSTNGDADSRPSSANPTLRQSGTSLADELDAQADGDADGDVPPDSATTLTDSKERRLQGELNSLKDQNKALTLYINNIISRLLQHEAFEQILDKTPDLMSGAPMAKAASGADTERDLPPPPPPPKDDKPVPADESQGQSLLQRAGSVLRGRAGRPTRPMSQALTPDQMSHLPETTSTLHSNPETAPRIPLGRSPSTRAAGASAHRRANSDWPAASVVTNMYKGPTPSLTQGPTSPGLGSPTTGARGAVAGSFFPRTVSGNTVPTTISEATSDAKENQPPPPVPPHREIRPSAPRDASTSGIRSGRSSVISNPDNSTNFADAAAMAALTGESGSSNPSSPPRSTTSSGDRDARAAGSGGAIMMGSKPRPLRLVQEAGEKEKAGANANRGSWFGWMNKGAGGLMQGRSVSGGEGQGQTPPPPQQQQ